MNLPRMRVVRRADDRFYPQWSTDGLMWREVPVYTDHQFHANGGAPTAPSP